MAVSSPTATILSHQFLSCFPNPIPLFNSRNSFAPPLSSNNKKLSSLTSSSVLKLHLKKTTEKWKHFALSENFSISEATLIEDSQLVDSTTSESGGSYIISALLFVAFIGLTILSIGVIYIAVTDFLQKREKDKFEKEETAKKKKGGKKEKIKTPARAGPRGFGQKVENEVDDDDDMK